MKINLSNLRKAITKTFFVLIILLSYASYAKADCIFTSDLTPACKPGADCKPREIKIPLLQGIDDVAVYVANNSSTQQQEKSIFITNSVFELIKQELMHSKFSKCLEKSDNIHLVSSLNGAESWSKTLLVYVGVLPFDKGLYEKIPETIFTIRTIRPSFKAGEQIKMLARSATIPVPNSMANSEITELLKKKISEYFYFYTQE